MRQFVRQKTIKNFVKKIRRITIRFEMISAAPVTKGLNKETMSVCIKVQLEAMEYIL